MRLPFSPKTIKGRLLAFFGVAICGTVALIAISLFTLNHNMYSIKNRAVEEMTQAAYSIVESYWQMVQSGEITTEVAQQRALRTLHSMRYGDGEYIWVNDMHPRMVMHPTTPELDGADLTHYADPHGKRLFMEMLAVVQRDGKGHVDYYWPKPGFGDPVPKSSYIMGFQPWGWVIGTGVYIDDINAMLWVEVQRMAIIIAIMLFVTAVPMIAIVRMIVLSTAAITDKARKLAAGDADLSKRISLSGEDELAQVAKYMNQYIEKAHREQQAMIQQAKLAEIGGMVGAIAHQWKQPLNNINLLAADLAELYRSGELTKEELEFSTTHIQQQVDYMAQTVDDFRNFYKPSDKTRNFCPQQQIRDVLELMRGQLMRDKVILTFFPSEVSPQVYGCPNEFKQVFLNLIHNSRDVFQERKVDERMITITASVSEGMLRFTVRDNGGGIPDELLPDALFDSFTSTKGEHGTGIGLSLCRQIVAKMGGTIQARNTDGGAEFCITLRTTDVV
ncbi:cache domain-containing protein [Chrysiogenes arsenatis]|uniref:cache domain-containing protein n=1 Tax=Chrysiogenes arsenatis TaxID=309797 RepID=UPI0003FD3859|nr:cache domain-containing protein [Chrysiogenes arsenatis]